MRTLIRIVGAFASLCVAWCLELAMQLGSAASVDPGALPDAEETAVDGDTFHEPVVDSATAGLGQGSHEYLGPS